MLSKKWLLPVLMLLCLTLNACSTSNASPLPSTTPSLTSTGNPNQGNANQPTASYSDIKVSPQEAYDTFTKKYPNSKVSQLGLDYEDGSYVYEVKGYDGTNQYELEINPMDGQILKEEQPAKGSGKGGEVTPAEVAKIQSFIDQALKDAGNDYRVEEWDLKSGEEHNNEVVSSATPQSTEPLFTITAVNSSNKDIEYAYNAKTGELLGKGW